VKYTNGNDVVKIETKGCWNCARKHLGEAVTWFQESEMGHPEHFWAGVGALSHAEREVLPLDQEAANAIRQARHGCYGGVLPDVMLFIRLVNDKCGSVFGVGVESDCGACKAACRLSYDGSPLRSQPDYGEREVVGRRSRCALKK